MQLEAFYSTHDMGKKVELTEAITAQVLTPVGGAWRRGEALAFAPNGLGPDEGLARKGMETYQELFGEN